MPNATINGVKLSYRQVFPDPNSVPLGDVILVHGLAANQAFWNLELVSTLATKYRVTSYDLRGHGYSARPPSCYTPRDMASDLQGILDHLNIQSAHLVGHSYGGLIALRLATDQPHRIRSLTLADTRLRGIAPEQILPQQNDWPELQARLARCGVNVQPDEPEIGMLLLEGIAEPRWAEARQRLAARGHFVPFAAQSGGGNRSATRWKRLLQETTAREDFLHDGGIRPEAVARLNLPLLLAYGEHSPHLASYRSLTELAPQSQAALVPGGGHFHPASRASQFTTLLSAFLGQIASGGDNTTQAATSSQNNNEREVPR